MSQLETNQVAEKQNNIILVYDENYGNWDFSITFLNELKGANINNPEIIGIIREKGEKAKLILTVSDDELEEIKKGNKEKVEILLGQIKSIPERTIKLQ